MDAYSLWEHEGTGELHLFKGTMTPESKTGKCTTAAVSACRRMRKVENAGSKFQCQTESEARISCAKIGREVCGTCVSTLYTTYN